MLWNLQLDFWRLFSGSLTGVFDITFYTVKVFNITFYTAKVFRASQLSLAAFIAPWDKTSFSWHTYCVPAYNDCPDNLGEQEEEDGKIFWAQRNIWKAGVISSVKKLSHIIWSKEVLQFSLIFTELAQNTEYLTFKFVLAHKSLWKLTGLGTLGQ